MFEGFSQEARHVMSLAQKGALELGHARVGTEHLLLGLLEERDSLGARTLVAHGITAVHIHDEIAATFLAGEAGPDDGRLPYSRRAKRALEKAAQVAFTLGSTAVGTGHLLLGLLAVEDDAAVNLLVGCGLESATIRADVMRSLKEGSDRQPQRMSLPDSPALAEDYLRPASSPVAASPDQIDPSLRADDGAEPCLAQAHLRRLGVPATVGPYTREDATRVMQGRAVDPAVEYTVHNKLAWIVGVQIVSHIRAGFPGLAWTTDRVPVRTLSEGESSASFLSFPDGSHAVLVSRALQESLIRMANVVEYFDISVASSGLSRRRRKLKNDGFDTSARATAMFRYLLLGQRMLGRAPSAPAVLDSQSFDIAGKMAAGAVSFVVAHEIAHIAHGHGTSSIEPHSLGSTVTVSEVQELQADAWALGFLKELMSDDPDPENIALWCAFIALIATFITEEAVYVRRNRTHPQAWVRWAMLERFAGESDDRTQRLRLALMAAVAGALELDEPFPEELWPQLWKDRMLSIDPAIERETVKRWDHLQTCSLDFLTAEAERSATAEGKKLLEALRLGDVPEALGRVVKPRRMVAMLDPDSALAFSTLKDAIEASAPLFTGGDRLLFSVAGARLAAQHLGGRLVDA